MACSPGFMGNATNEKSEGRLEKGKWGKEGEVAQVGIFQFCWGFSDQCCNCHLDYKLAYERISNGAI